MMVDDSGEYTKLRVLYFLLAPKRGDLIQNVA